MPKGLIEPKGLQMSSKYRGIYPFEKTFFFGLQRGISSDGSKLTLSGHKAELNAVGVFTLQLGKNP